MIDVTEIQIYMLKNNNMSNKELAEAIGTTPNTLLRWFKKRDMPVSFAEKIGHALSIPANNMQPIFFTDVVAWQETIKG